MNEHLIKLHDASVRVIESGLRAHDCVTLDRTYHNCSSCKSDTRRISASFSASALAIRSAADLYVQTRNGRGIELEIKLVEPEKYSNAAVELHQLLMMCANDAQLGTQSYYLFVIDDERYVMSATDVYTYCHSFRMYEGLNSEYQHVVYRLLRNVRKLIETEDQKFISPQRDANEGSNDPYALIRIDNIKTHGVPFGDFLRSMC